MKKQLFLFVVIMGFILTVIAIKSELVLSTHKFDTDLSHLAVDSRSGYVSWLSIKYY